MHIPGPVQITDIFFRKVPCHAQSFLARLVACYFLPNSNLGIERYARSRTTKGLNILIIYESQYNHTYLSIPLGPPTSLRHSTLVCPSRFVLNTLEWFRSWKPKITGNHVCRVPCAVCRVPCRSLIAAIYYIHKNAKSTKSQVLVLLYYSTSTIVAHSNTHTWIATRHAKTSSVTWLEAANPSNSCRRAISMGFNWSASPAHPIPSRMSRIFAQLWGRGQRTHLGSHLYCTMPPFSFPVVSMIRTSCAQTMF